MLEDSQIFSNLRISKISIIYTMFNKVFISYAREDFEFAEEIYGYLEVNNFIPWMDKKRLMIGDRWENQIMTELKIADFIILLLSKTSVAKRGFVQREFKYALKYAEEKLNSDIFILPIKLDDCQVPEELAIFNWAEFNPVETQKEILLSLNHQRNKIINSLPKDLVNLNNYTEQEVKLEGEIDNLYSYYIKYPVFLNTTTTNTEMLNIEIQHFINDKISFLRKELLSSSVDDTKIQFKIDKCTLEISYAVGLINDHFASILFYEYIDFLGAHPNHSWTSINVGFNPNRTLSYLDIEDSDKLHKLLKDYKYDFTVEEPEILEDNFETFNEYSSNDSFFPKQFEFFLLDKETIQINFSNHLPHVAKALGQFEFKYKIENNKISLS